MFASEKEREDQALDALLALALGVGGFVLYLATLAPTVLYADGGEFQFVPYILGIAHPTGYPLYLLLGWAWSHILPLGDVAYRMNLFSAFWAALAVGLTYPTAVYFVKRGAPGIGGIPARLAAVTATAIFAVGQTFWSQAVIAEVYSFNAFFVALILLLLFGVVDCLEKDTLPTLGRISPLALRRLALATAYGLSLTHHPTVLLLLPGILAFLWLAGRDVQPRPRSARDIRMGSRSTAAPETRPLSLFGPRSGLRRAGFALALIVALLAPLLLYLYLPLRAPHTPYATLELSESQMLTVYENSWHGFVNHLTASAFAGNLALANAQPAVSVAWGERLLMAWRLLRQEIGLIGIGLALVGLGRLLVDRRWALVALTGLGYGLGVGFNLVYLIGDVHVLFIPSYLFVALWLGLGIVSVAQAVAQGLVRWKGASVTYGDFGQQGYQRLTEGVYRLITRLVAFLALVVPIVLLMAHLPKVNQSRNTEARDTWQAILAKPIPYGSVLLSDDRDEMMPLWYYQYVEGRRPDLVGLFPLVVAEPGYASLGGVIDQALLSQRPVYLIKPMPGLEVKAQLEHVPDMFPLIRVTTPAVERPPLHPRQIVLAGQVRLVGYDQAPSSARPGDSLAITLYWQPQSEIPFDYSSYVHLVDKAGRGITQSDHQLGGDYYPTSLWRPGELLRDSHVLTIPQGAALGVYRLVVGMYRYPSLEPLGGPADVGLLAVKDPDEMPVTLPDTLRATELEFGDRVLLLGYDPRLGEVGLEITLFWQAERLLDQNWTVFVHLLDEAGVLVAQHDSQPQNGQYPTSVWDQGEVVSDRHWLALPTDLPNGDYRILVGLYSLESGERMSVLDSEGNPFGDSTRLLGLALSDREWEIK